MPSKPRNQPGRPSFRPEAAQRKQVLLLAGRGFPQDHIAAFLTISPKTLRKHFRAELKLGSLRANAAVLQRLQELATSGMSNAATIFWAKARCGLRPAQGVIPPEEDLNTNRGEKTPQSTGPIRHGANS